MHHDGSNNGRGVPDAPMVSVLTESGCCRWAWPLLVVAAVYAHLAADAVAQGSVATDRAALVALYDATGGSTWTNSTNWKTDAPLGEWYGVTTGADGRVTRLDLRENTLTGPIPDALGSLSNLEWLSLFNNELTGLVPNALGSLSKLRSLSLGGNALTGTIPEALGRLSSLTDLYLYDNELTGPIPEALGRLSSLTDLYLYDNELTGPIPEALGRLSSLTDLYLYDNELTGPIPEVLGGLSNLQVLDLGRNALTGPIPEALGNLSNLVSLWLQSNALTGPIPDALGNLSGLTQLVLSDNELTGPIPEVLGSLSNLEWLSLDNNELTGPVPNALGSLSKLRNLSLDWNALTGPIPQALGNLSELRNLSLGGNALTGPIPEALGRLSNLQGLNLSNNALTGPIPEALGNLSNLVSLWLEWNGLIGPLPSELTRLTRLTRLKIENTGLCAPADSAFQEWLTPIDFSGSTCRDNRSPEPVAMIPAQTLTVGGAALGVDVAGYFRDPDDDPLSYEAVSSDEDRATVSVSDSIVWLAPGEAGTATVTVTARDPAGLSATLTMAVTVVVSSGPQSDYEVLAAFYGATGGPTWTDSTNWKTDAPLGEWYGVTTDVDGRVTMLDLRENALTGTIPDALGHLSRLVSLSLASNAMTGPIPDALGRLSNLDSLDLFNNEFTGPIPEALGRLSNIQGLHLSSNALTGTIPEAFGRLSKLVSLNLSRNALTGPLPRDLRRLSNLESLDLSYNWGVSGPLRDGLRLPRLRHLDIWVTQACAPSAWRDWVRTIDFRGAPCGVDADVTIDVALVYTPAAREAAGGTAAIEAVIDLMIAETNQAYAESGVRHRIALVARSEVPYTETGDSHIDLDRLRDPSDGYMDEVHALREASGADLVHLLFDEGSVSGIAIRGGAFGLGCQRCGGGLFAHETGHNLGLRHDRYEEQKNSGTTSGDPAYGYVNQRAFDEGATHSSRWATIMSYPTQCNDAYKSCGGLLRFSNPRQTWLGDPLGVAYEAGAFGVAGPADAVAVLNVTGPAAAAWRDRPPPEPEPFSIPNLGGRSITSNGTEADRREGYGRIRAEAGSTTPSGIAIFGFRQGGVLIAEAGVPATEAVQEGRIFAEVRGPVNTGLAIANPNDEPATILFHFRDAEGERFGDGQFELGAHRQTAKFLNDAPFNSGELESGTFTFTSSVPIAVIALRGLTNRDGEFLMTTLPVAPLASTSADTVYFPHFTDGDGWVTQVILVNPTDTTITGTVRFLGPGSGATEAAPAVLTLDDGRTGASFEYSIPAGSSQRFTTSNPSGSTTSGSVRATPDPASVAPSGLVVFSYTTDGKTVSESGVPALPSGSAFRVYAESSGTPNQAGSIRTGLAITNVADAVNTVTLEVTGLDGNLAMGVAPVTLPLPPSGQVARFLDEIFDSLPDNFSGVLRVTSTADVAIV